MEFAEKIRIPKGWSGDKKYRATTGDGKTCLLRVIPGGTLEKWSPWFDRMEQLARLGVPMSETYEIGECDEGVYAVQRWIDGEDAGPALARMTAAEQYRQGFEVGRILRIIHSVPAPPETPDWESRFNAKIDRKIKGYLDCPLRIEGDGCLLRYLGENRGLLKDRPNVYQHGDYHVGNMMFERASDGSVGQLTVIDFNREDFGDPWEEFNRIVWCAQTSPAFASGRVDGYFDGEVPELFWWLLCLYIASNTLSSIYWAIPFGEKEIRTMKNQAAEVLEWYENMTNPVPAWYGRK